ncbi:hypothetical protein, partial [Oceanibaculum indicum]
IIVYDKRADVIAKNKREWWEIWNAGRRAAGKPELDRHDRDGAQIWRVELRAGKHHLKEDWSIRSFADLDARLGDLYGRMMQLIRYTVPRPDTHRNRWLVHPLWHMATEAMKGDLSEMVSQADPERVKQVAREAHAEMLAAQGFGLFVSHAHMLGYGANDFLDYLDRRRDELAATARENPAALEDRFAKAEKRYVFI